MNENVVKTVKSVVMLVGGTGAAAIITNAARHLSPTTGAGLIMKICVGVGTALLSGIASDAACEYADKKIDKAIEFVKSTDTDIEKESEKEDTES